MPEEKFKSFTPPGAQHLPSANDAFPDEPTVTMNFPRPVRLTVEHLKGQVAFPAGPQEVPVSLKDHWYLKASGAVEYKPAKVVEKEPEVVQEDGGEAAREPVGSATDAAQVKPTARRKKTA